MAKVHIIGAGLAGLAAAVKLIKAGHDIHVYESAPQAGGRCRSHYDTLLERVIDNGNHVILGGNAHALAYIDKIGSYDSFVQDSLKDYHFVDLPSGQGWQIRPLWFLESVFRLVLAKGSDRVADCFVTSSLLYRRFIYPFCTAVLNTEPPAASVILLKRTLYELLKHGRKGMRSYYPQHSLTESLINPALRLIESNGGKVNYLRRLKAFGTTNGQITALQFADWTIDVTGDQVILATNPHASAALLDADEMPLTYNAIINGHFLCPGLDWPKGPGFLGVTGGAVQWIFYRNGILSTTTSAANSLALRDNPDIAALLWADIQKALKLSLPLPAHRIICEKQATLVQKSEQKAQKSDRVSNLRIAGDYTVTHLPNSIETAVQSGFFAAEQILQTQPPVAVKAA